MLIDFCSAVVGKRVKRWFKTGSVPECGYMDSKHSGVVELVWIDDKGDTLIHVTYEDNDADDHTYEEFLEKFTFPFINEENAKKPAAKRSLSFAGASSSSAGASSSSAARAPKMGANPPFPFSAAASPITGNDPLALQKMSKVH